MDYRGQKETELDQFINFYSSTSYSDESKWEQVGMENRGKSWEIWR